MTDEMPQRPNNVTPIGTITESLSAHWRTSEAPSTQRVVIMTIGLEGSGKSTFLRALSAEMGIEVISRDAIRQNLLDTSLPEKDRDNAVNTITAELIRRACRMGIDFAIDGNAKPVNIQRVQALLDRGGYSNYQILPILLQASPEKRQQRVAQRPPTPGEFTAGQAELNKSTEAFGELDANAYRAIGYEPTIIDTEQGTLESMVGQAMTAMQTAR